MRNPVSVLENERAKFSGILRYKHITKFRKVKMNLKKRIGYIEDIVAPENDWVKIKEKEKRDKY